MIPSLLLSVLAALPCQEPPAPAAPPIPADTEVVTTDSGLSYSVLAPGGEGGERPHLGDRVRVRYTGWLPDGKVFDSTGSGAPAEFGLGPGGLIEGWNEALQLMPVGARWKLTIPPALGYGEAGTDRIPPNATLIFELELLAIPARAALRFVPWDAAGGRTTEGGVAFELLEPGREGGLMERKALWIEFALWTEAGELLFSDLLSGRPLVMDPARPQLAVLKDLLPEARDGCLILARAPLAAMPELASSGIEQLEGLSHVLWQFRVVASSDFAKPDFVLPPDEELTATASGLKYKVLRAGSQLRPAPESQVVAHYAGWLTDGTPFDSSFDRDQPLSTPLGRLIRGWQEGMQLMGRGAVFLFVIPPDLGWGSQDKGTIPPDSTVVFVVELIDFR